MAVLGLALAWAVPADGATLDEVRALAAEERYAQAMAQLDEYLRTEPDDVEARLLKGVIYTRQGMTEEAIGVFEALSVDRPDLPEPLNNLAVLHAKRGRYELAREALSRAIVLAPRYDTAHENLGDIYAKLANLSYERAYSLNRRNETVKDKAQWMARVLETTVPAAAEPQATPGDAAGVAAGVTLGATTTRTVEPASDGGQAAARAPPITPPVCRAVIGIESDDIASAIVAWFVGNGLPARAQIVSQPDDVIYAVFVPPFDSGEAAEEAVRLMRRDGIVDIMRIKTGEFANGISLGAYRNRSNAERRIEVLRELGYNAELRPQRHGRAGQRVDVEKPVTAAMEGKFTAAFPGYVLHTSSCP